MHGAARNGDLPMLKELILLGADMHVRDSVSNIDFFV